MPAQFLHPDAPAFKPGAVWNRADGTPWSVTVVSCAPWPGAEPSPWHHTVLARDTHGNLFEKDVWNFQVRYFPS